MPPTDAELQKAADTLGIDVQKLKNARDTNTPLNIDALMTSVDSENYSDYLQGDDRTSYEQIAAFLGLNGGPTTSADAPLITLNTGGEQFDNWAPPSTQQAIDNLAANPTPQAYNDAYNVITAGWPAEARTVFPQHVFNIFADKLGNQLGTALSGLMDAVTAAGMAGSDAAMFIKSTATTLAQSRNPQDAITNVENAIAAAKKTGAVAGSSAGSATSTLQQPVNTILGI